MKPELSEQPYGGAGFFDQHLTRTPLFCQFLYFGFEVAQSTVSKYMVRGGSPSQGWKTFFRNHAQAIVAIDLFVVPTLTFERLFAFWCWATAGGNCYGSR